MALIEHHTFDGPPKRLIIGTLEKMGTPQKLLHNISMVLERGSTFIRGAEHEVFCISHGVKQGCPLLCLYLLRFLISAFIFYRNGLVFSAFVGDISSPAPL